MWGKRKGRQFKVSVKGSEWCERKGRQCEVSVKGVSVM